MAQILTVCRIGTGWGFRDVTGAEYGHSADINLVVETARRVAHRAAGHVVFSAEAEQHYLDQAIPEPPVDSQLSAEVNSRLRFRSLLARLAWWRGK